MKMKNQPQSKWNADPLHNYLLCFGVILVLAPCALAETQRYAVATPQPVGNVSQAEATLYYQSVITTLQSFGNTKLVERHLTEKMIAENDLAMAFPGMDKGGNSRPAANLSADILIVPGICKVQHDYFLSLRKLSPRDGTTEFCQVKTTRIPSNFSSCARELVLEMLGNNQAATKNLPSSVAPSLALTEIRDACIRMGANNLFPALWKRAEGLLAKAAVSSSPSELRGYYESLLRFSARALAPPSGMVYVPGGYATVHTSAGTRSLWVAPFFIDRSEVSVKDYMNFLKDQAHNSRNSDAGRLAPITQGKAGFGAPNVPVTGVTFWASAAFAQSQGKRLPTALQWYRATGCGPNRKYPCVNHEPHLVCNLRGIEDGHVILAPVGLPVTDVSAFGIFNMTGNVSEWTCTWFDRDLYAGVPEDAPTDPPNGVTTVILGGSGRTGAIEIKAEFDRNHRANESLDDVGIRCVLPFFFDDVSTIASNVQMGSKRNKESGQ